MANRGGPAAVGFRLRIHFSRRLSASGGQELAGSVRIPTPAQEWLSVVVLGLFAGSAVAGAIIATGAFLAVLAHLAGS